MEAGAAPAADRQTLPPPPSPLLLPLSPALSPEAAALAAQAGTAIRLAAWLALLFAGYGLQRGLCAGGLPSDCGAVVAGDIYAALTQLAFTGGALGALAGVMRPDRFAWLASPRRAWLWLAYLALFPAYSALSNIPALQASLATTGSWGPAMFALTAVVGAAVVAALAFHLWLAWRAGGGSGGGDSSSGIPAGGAGTGRAALPGLPVVFTAQMAAVADSGSGTSTPRSPCKHCRSAGSSLGSLSDAGSSGWDEDTTQPLHARARSVGSSLGGAVGVAAAGGAPVDASLRRRRLRAARWRCLGLYLLPRLAALAYFAAWLGGLPASGAYSLHLHHYALGFAVAIFAAFNHPVSGLVLALATAVFVQVRGCGIGELVVRKQDRCRRSCRASLGRWQAGAGRQLCATGGPGPGPGFSLPPASPIPAPPHSPRPSAGSERLRLRPPA